MRKKNIPAVLYGILWLILIGLYWLGLFPGGNAFPYALLSHWIILPLVGFGAALYYGRQDGWGKWAFPVAASALAVLHQCLTFGLSNGLSTGHFDLPRLEYVGLTLPCAVAGCVIGILIRKFKKNEQ